MSIKISLLEKIFIWSLIIEPMSFFVFSTSLQTYIPLTLSRTLQLLFLIGYSCNFLFFNKGVPRIKLFTTNYIYLKLFLLVTFFAGINGFYSGNYQLNTINDINLPISALEIRAWFEVFILLFYFFYFLIMPAYIIRSKIQLEYLFTWIVRLMYLIVAIGLLEFICYQFLLTNLIPRHLVDSHWVDVGNRFHSFVGEPRVAFVYLIFMIAFLFLKQSITQQKVSLVLIGTLIMCAILTKSFSGIAGLIFALGVLMVYSEKTIKSIFTSLLLIIISVIFIIISVNYSIRIYDYYKMMISIPEVITTLPLPYYLNAQAPEIIPLWLFFQRIINFDIIYAMFGSGFASSAFSINNFLGQSYIGHNPMSQLTRLIYDSGVIGTHLYLMLMIKPIKDYLNLTHPKNSRMIWISSVFLIGAVLGVRSNVGLIYVGILIAIMTNNLDKSFSSDVMEKK